MKKKAYFWISGCLLAAFILWTAAICTIDVKPIGPDQSSVGFATINGFFHTLTGVHMTLYHITDWLGLVPVAFCLGFAFLGLFQWINRKSIRNVDFSILILGGFYIVTFAAYFLFEEIVINYRPVLIEGRLEASYPSSTTLMVLCVIPTALMHLRSRITHMTVRKCVTLLLCSFMIFMVLGRLISGVHWLTDIIGGVLLSSSLVTMYYAITSRKF